MNINSYAMLYKEKLGGMDLLRTIVSGITNGSMYKGNRYFIGFGIFNVSGLSSKCCAGLLKEWKEDNKDMEVIYTERQKLERQEKLKKKILASSDARFKELLRQTEEEASKLKVLKVNRRGRGLLNPEKYNVLINEMYKYEGMMEVKFRVKSKYAELIVPYESLNRQEMIELRKTMPFDGKYKSYKNHLLFRQNHVRTLIKPVI